ncbi:MAG TPA: hypothetical protein VLA46_00380 [Saprospiraceae bacterium]|nr:hypothetical protein [Saprospiraceae bacterium]
MNRLTKYIFFTIFLAACGMDGIGQIDTLAMFGITHQQEEGYRKWLDNLYEVGVKVEGDSIYITEETRRVAADTAYRKLIYPKMYDWTTANALFKQMQYKIAFWYLINIYYADISQRESVLKYVLTLEEVFAMDKVLISVFYTYGLLDPEVADIVNGKPDIHHPEIVEQKLASVKEMVQYIMAYREQNVKK